MSVAYRLLYRVGCTPWEQIATLPAVTAQISALFDREEAGRQPPYGQALDLGCGSGIWAVKLAARGWQVTGVDFVPRAVRMARQRARDAGVEIRLLPLGTKFGCPRQSGRAPAPRRRSECPGRAVADNRRSSKAGASGVNHGTLAPPETDRRLRAPIDKSVARLGKEARATVGRGQSLAITRKAAAVSVHRSRVAASLFAPGLDGVSILCHRW